MHGEQQVYFEVNGQMESILTSFLRAWSWERVRLYHVETLSHETTVNMFNYFFFEECPDIGAQITESGVLLSAG